MREVKTCNNLLLRHATITKSKYKGHQRLKALYTVQKKALLQGLGLEMRDGALNNNPL